MPCEGPVHLRRATVEDAAGIAAVHMDGWERAHQGLVPDDYITCRSARLREEFWREELEVESADRTPWVAMLEDRVIGFAASGITRDDDTDTATGEIYQLFVAPECWQRGIRTNLIEHCVRDLEEHTFERVIFWVLAADDMMRAFAEHVGFTADGATRFEDCGSTKVEELRYSKAIG